MGFVFVDCEAFNGCPRLGRLTEFGAVTYPDKKTFHGIIIPSEPDPANPAVPLITQKHLIGDEQYYLLATPVFAKFADWLKENTKGRAVMVSDNPAFDFQWINDGFLVTRLDLDIKDRNPFGHSARRLSDYYAGLMYDFFKTQDWKRWRVTPHDHNPVNDSMGNVEAFETMQIIPCGSCRQQIKGIVKTCNHLEIP